MWLPLTRRTACAARTGVACLTNSLTQGPVALTTARARTVSCGPARGRSVALQPAPAGVSRSQRTRVSTVAPRACASSAFSTTRRASSTQPSE